jgi:hypothetical protein
MTITDERGRDLEQLRSYLDANNGMPGLTIVDPGDTARAVELFHRDGFVVVHSVLTEEQTAFLAQGCREVADEIVALDPDRAGNRGSGRYSFGGSSRTRSQLHRPEWQMLLDLPVVDAMATAIFGSEEYLLRAASGDFCLPDTPGYQPLHADVHDRIPGNPRSRYSSFHDPSGLVSLRDLPCPYLCVNFLPQDVTRLNGPTRQIPGTQRSRAPIPSLRDEPEWMRLSTVCPAPAGAAMFRDVRAWHGGTPNVSDHMRAIPNLELYAPWFREPMIPGISYADHQKLSPRARYLSRYCVLDSSETLQTGATLQVD